MKQTEKKIKQLAQRIEAWTLISALCDLVVGENAGLHNAMAESIKTVVNEYAKKAKEAK